MPVVLGHWREAAGHAAPERIVRVSPRGGTVKAAFVLTAGDPLGYVAALSLTDSIRATMPGVEVVQLTDESSPSAIGVDAVRRHPAMPGFARFIAEHHAAVDTGDWLFLDTDCVVQADVSDVFGLDFDLAVASREGTYLEGEADSAFMAANPYNAGVVFSRSADARRAVAARVAAMPDEWQRWFGHQRAVCDLIAIGSARHAILSSAYNYPPKSADDPITDKAIVHYKGPGRKALLWRRIYRDVVCASA